MQPSRPSVPTAFPAVQIPQNLDSATIFTDDGPEESLSPFLSIARFSLLSLAQLRLRVARLSASSVSSASLKPRIRSSLLAGSPPASPPLTATPTPPGRRGLCFDPDPSPSGARQREAADCYCASLFVLRESRSFSSTLPRFALPATSASTRTALRNQKKPLNRGSTVCSKCLPLAIAITISWYELCFLDFFLSPLTHTPPKSTRA